MRKTPFDGPSDAPVQEIGILLMTDFSNLTFASFLEPLRAVNRLAAQTFYRWRLFSVSGSATRSSSGLELAVESELTGDETLPLLVAIASYKEADYSSPSLLARLRKLARRGCMMGGLESGAYTLARAGLLDGYRATTHWEDLEDFADSFPAVEVLQDRFVIDRNRFSAGGAAPALDLSLHLIRMQHGMSLALDTASTFIYEQARQSSDPQQIISLGPMRSREPKLAAAIRLMEDHIEEPLPIETIALRTRVSTRELQRLFQLHLTTSPQSYYLSLRLNAGLRLLQSSRKPVTEIALICGFSSSSAFARAFGKRFGESPRTFRRRLKGQ